MSTHPDPSDWLKQKQAQWAIDGPRWHYVIETFWHLDYPQMVEKLSLFKSLDDAVEQADRERGGMIAT